MTVLTGHTSQETAYVVEDYPYGFRLRCKIRYWIETKKGHGQRVMSQTTDPKRGNGWTNKPKGSTYNAIKVLYIDDNGHVQNAAIDIYSTTPQIDAFETLYAAALTSERDQGALRYLRSLQLAYERRRQATEDK